MVRRWWEEGRARAELGGLLGRAAGLRTRCQEFYTAGRARGREGTCLPARTIKSQVFFSKFPFIKVMNKETNKLYFYLLEFYQCLNINI